MRQFINIRHLCKHTDIKKSEVNQMLLQRDKALIKQINFKTSNVAVCENNFNLKIKLYALFSCKIKLIQRNWEVKAYKQFSEHVHSMHYTCDFCSIFQLASELAYSKHNYSNFDLKFKTETVFITYFLFFINTGENIFNDNRKRINS